jgi:hypothetical protein
MPVWQDQNFSSIQRRSSMGASSLRSKITISPTAGKCARSEWTRTAPAPLDPLEHFDLG